MDSDSDPFDYGLLEGGDDSSSEASLDEAEEEDDNSSSEASVDNQEEDWLADLQRIRENNSITSRIHGRGEHNFLHNMTDEEWEELGRDMSNNTHLEDVHLDDGALNDHKISFLFRGLTKSNSIEDINFCSNALSVQGVRSMVPFLQNAANFSSMYLVYNNLLSEGFNELFRALRNNPIEILNCSYCGICSIQIDIASFPRNLTYLMLNGNKISTDGCRVLAKLLQEEDSTLAHLQLRKNKIGDEGVAILVDALQNNKSLGTLDLRGNDGISKQGQILLLKLVNDISCIKATLQSNHTLRYLNDKCIIRDGYPLNVDEEIQKEINFATKINRNHDGNPDAAGREKVIQTQLHSVRRSELADLQGVDHSVFSEIGALQLPEVLALVGRSHGQGELYVALKSVVMGLFSSVNMIECIQQERDFHAAKVEELDAKLATMKEAAVAVRNQVDMVFQSNKRRRQT